MLDEVEIRRLGEIYANAMDRGDGAALSAIFTEDAIIDGPKQSFLGKNAIREIPDLLRSRYHATRHTTYNQTVHISGDTAHGETYCSAQHITRGGPDDGKAFVMEIRYQDKYRREPDGWKFSCRQLVVDWTETKAVVRATQPSLK